MRYKIALLLLLLIPQVCWGGINFDGTDDSINCGSNTSLDNLTTMTICAWINPATFQAGSNARRIYQKGSTTRQRPRFATLDTQGLLLVGAHNTSGAWYASGSAQNVLTPDVWQHVCGTWTGGSGAGAVKLFVNGSVVSSTDNNSAGTLYNEAGDNAVIGDNGGATAVFNGPISELAIWNVVLSNAQIAQLANAKLKRLPLQLSDPDADGVQELVAYWSMDEVTDGASADLVTLFDLSGNANNGNPDNGANNTGCLGVAETVLSYPDEFAQ